VGGDWKSKPASDKQRRFVRYLMRAAGSREALPEELTQGQASRLIGQLEGQKPAQDPDDGRQARDRALGYQTDGRHLRVAACLVCGVRTGRQGEFCSRGADVYRSRPRRPGEPAHDGPCAWSNGCWNCTGREAVVQTPARPQLRLVRGARAGQGGW